MTGAPILVRSVGSTVSDLLAAPATGSLLAVFPRSCYLELAGRIVALVVPELLRGPLNVVIDPPPAFRFEDLAAGAAVALDPQLVPGPPRLSIQRGPVFDLSAMEIWDARLTPLRSANRGALARRLDRIKPVLAGAPSESLAHPDGRPARAAEAMDALYSGLRHAQDAAVAHGARGLAGLGSGLTPSGDDVLTGILIAVALLHPAHADRVRGAAMEAVRERTTRISLAYLDAASRGEAGEAWHVLAHHLDDGPDEAVATAAADVRAFGETSGADMLAGFVLAMEAMR